MNKPLSKNLQNSLVYVSATEVNISGNVGGKNHFEKKSFKDIYCN